MGLCLRLEALRKHHLDAVAASAGDSLAWITIDAEGPSLTYREVAEAMGERALVLGAWGCGVFRNDPEMVAAHFDEVLAEMRGAFDVVVFAVLDTSAEQKNLAPFARRFGAVT